MPAKSANCIGILYYLILGYIAVVEKKSFQKIITSIMAQKFEKLFDKSCAKQLTSLFDFIYEAFVDLKTEKLLKVKWTSIKESEYGFYLNSVDNKMSLFCGIYFEGWAETGHPLCFCLDWKKGVSQKIVYDFKSIIEKEQNSLFKYVEICDNPLLLFSSGYFDTPDSLKQAVDLYIKIANLLKFNIYVNKS